MSAEGLVWFAFASIAGVFLLADDTYMFAVLGESILWIAAVSWLIRGLHGTFPAWLDPWAYRIKKADKQRADTHSS